MRRRASFAPAPRRHRLFEHFENAGMGAERDVEAHEAASRLRQAEHIAWRKDDVVLQSMSRDVGGVEALGQARPQEYAAARLYPRLEPEGAEAAHGLAHRRRQFGAQSAVVEAIDRDGE